MTVREQILLEVVVALATKDTPQVMEARLNRTAARHGVKAELVSGLLDEIAEYCRYLASELERN